MRVLQFLLRKAYALLYHQFAWTYDFVSAVVSLGHWQEWVQTVLPRLNGRVLEIGFGPGHLQLSLSRKTQAVFGLDESRQMARQASRRMLKKGVIPRLTRGYAQNIPFCSGIFNSVATTFPSDYIYDQQTLREIWRVLMPGGSLIILPMAWITGGRPLERLAAWLFKVSGETTGKPGLASGLGKDRLIRAGFKVQSDIVKMKSSQVLVIIGTKWEEM